MSERTPIETPPQRRTWTDDYGAITLDTVFATGRLTTCANAPYHDLASLVAYARGIMEATGGQYHAFHSGFWGDIVITASEVFLWDDDGVDPLPEFDADDERTLRDDALLRNVAGTIEAQGIEAAFGPIEQALSRVPDRPELMEFLSPLMGVHKYSLAGQIVDARLGVEPNDVRALVEDAQMTMNLVAQRQWGRDHLASANDRLEQVLQLEPEHLRAKLMWCELPRYGGDPAASVPRFEDLLAQDPTCGIAHYNLAAIHLADDPLSHFERGAQLDQGDPDYLLGQARALIALGRRNEAAAALEVGRRLAPQHPRIAQIEQALVGS